MEGQGHLNAKVTHLNLYGRSRSLCNYCIRENAVWYSGNILLVSRYKFKPLYEYEIQQQQHLLDDKHYIIMLLVLTKNKNYVTYSTTVINLLFLYATLLHVQSLY